MRYASIVSICASLGVPRTTICLQLDIFFFLLSQDKSDPFYQYQSRLLGLCYHIYALCVHMYVCREMVVRGTPRGLILIESLLLESIKSRLLPHQDYYHVYTHTCPCEYIFQLTLSSLINLYDRYVSPPAREEGGVAVCLGVAAEKGEVGRGCHE